MQIFSSLSWNIFRLRPLAYPGTDLVLMICSKSAYTTLTNLKFKWDKEIKYHIPRAYKMLVINKNDLDTPDHENESMITEEAAEKAKKYLKMDALFFTSAKTGENVQELLREAVKLALKSKESSSERLCSLLWFSKIIFLPKGWRKNVIIYFKERKYHVSVCWIFWKV